MEWVPAPSERKRQAEPRVGMTVSCMGCGEHAKMVVFGGSKQSGLLGGLAVLDVKERRWCTNELQLRGVPAQPREGHTAGVIGRHALLIFGGVDSSGQLLQGRRRDALMLLHYATFPQKGLALSWARVPLSMKVPFLVGRSVPSESSDKSNPNPACFPASCREPVRQCHIEYGASDLVPDARVHHAMAELGCSLLLFGGEVAAASTTKPRPERGSKEAETRERVRQYVQRYVPHRPLTGEDPADRRATGLLGCRYQSVLRRSPDAHSIFSSHC